MPLDVNNQPDQDIWRSALHVFSDLVSYQSSFVKPLGSDVFEVVRLAQLDTSRLLFVNITSGFWYPDPVSPEDLLTLLRVAFIQEKGFRPSWLMPGYEYGYLWDDNQHRFRRALRQGTQIQWE